MVLVFAAIIVSLFCASRTARSGGSRRGGGRAGRDAFLILLSVALEKGSAGGLMATAVPDESPCCVSRLARPGDGGSGAGRVGKNAFLVQSPVNSE